MEKSIFILSVLADDGVYSCNEVISVHFSEVLAFEAAKELVRKKFSEIHNFDFIKSSYKEFCEKYSLICAANSLQELNNVLYKMIQYIESSYGKNFYNAKNYEYACEVFGITFDMNKNYVPWIFEIQEKKMEDTPYLNEENFILEMEESIEEFKKSQP